VGIKVLKNMLEKQMEKNSISFCPICKKKQKYIVMEPGFIISKCKHCFLTNKTIKEISKETFKFFSDSVAKRVFEDLASVDKIIVEK